MTSLFRANAMRYASKNHMPAVPSLYFRQSFSIHASCMAGHTFSTSHLHRHPRHLPHPFLARIARDEATRVHEHASLHPRLRTQLLVPQAPPRFGQRFPRLEAVFTLRNGLNAPFRTGVRGLGVQDVENLRRLRFPPG